MKSALAPLEGTLQPSTQASTYNGKLGWRSRILAPTQNTASQFERYVVVGGIAFLVDFFTLYACTDWIHIYYLTSTAIAFIAGIACNYVLSRAWVFDRRTMQNTWVEFTVFAVIGVIGLGLTEVGMWFFAGKLYMYYLLAKINTAVLVLLWNFFARKYVLFR